MINHNVHYFRNRYEWIPLLEAYKKLLLQVVALIRLQEVTSNMTNVTAGAGGWKTFEPTTMRISNSKRLDSGGGINLVSKTI